MVRMSIGLSSLLFTVTLFAADGFKPLFNGKDLDGWQVDTAGLWQARDGMIIGQSQGLKHNDFLRSKATFSNFILKVSVRLVDNQGNSGIQFRTKAIPNSHEVSGYQADIINKDPAFDFDLCWGCLYDEGRRNKYLARSSPESLASLRKDGWNEFVITAQDNHITIDFNGVRTLDYHETEPGIDTSGFIALQIHAGPPMQVQFKDIQIRALK
jgi:3-keto-disaccharide hydrolase